MVPLEEPKGALFQSMDPAGRRLTGPALERLRRQMVALDERVGAAREARR